MPALPPDELRRAYDRSAEGYDERFAQLQAVKYAALLLRFRPPKGQRVLDLGCGTGRLLPRLAEFECEPYALDLSRAMLAKVRWLAPRVQGSALALPFADRAFDGVFAVTSLLFERRELVESFVEIARVMRPAATLALSLLTRDVYEGLEDDLAASGLQVQSTFPCGQDTGWICLRSSIRDRGRAVP